jgi:alpha-L-fucosidase
MERKSDSLLLPPLPDATIKKAWFLNGDAVSFTKDREGYHIGLPGTLPDGNCSVIVLELDRNAEDLPVIKQ